MAILQVNVRPADRDSSRPRSQWRENASDFVTYMNRSPNGSFKGSSMHRNGSTPHPQPFPDAQPKAPARTGGPDGLGMGGSPSSPTPAPSQTQQTILWTLTPDATVGRALVSASQRLSEAGCQSARLDAQVLLAHVLGQSRSWLFAHHEHELTPAQAEQYTELVARRIDREPVAYLVGRREFYGLDFYVDRRVLIPRPETELLVDLVLAEIVNRQPRRTVIADVGTGSGAIAITLATRAPEAHIYGLDISADALAVAQINAQRLAPTRHLHFLESDLLEGLPEPADIIVANLPYISEDAYSQLAPDIRQHEPPQALLAGEEGLDVIRRLLDQIDGKLKPGGVVWLEIGADQGELVQEAARNMQPAPSYIGLRRDYSGHPRCVTLEF